MSQHRAPDTDGLAASAKSLRAAGIMPGSRVEVGPRTFEQMYRWAVERQPVANREYIALQLRLGKLAVTYLGYVAKPLRDAPEWRMYPADTKRNSDGSCTRKACRTATV